MMTGLGKPISSPIGDDKRTKSIPSLHIFFLPAGNPVTIKDDTNLFSAGYRFIPCLARGWFQLLLRDHGLVIQGLRLRIGTTRKYDEKRTRTQSPPGCRRPRGSTEHEPFHEEARSRRVPASLLLGAIPVLREAPLSSRSSLFGHSNYCFRSCQATQK